MPPNRRAIPEQRRHPARPMPTVANHPRGWTRLGVEQHQAKFARAMVVLHCQALTAPDLARLRAQLDDARAEIAHLRQRVHAGHELADAQRRARELEALLLADDEHTHAATEEIAMRRVAS